MNKNVNHANLTISHHATVHFSIHSSSFLASKWEWIITSGWSQDWHLPAGSYSLKTICVPLPRSIAQYPCITAIQHWHTLDMLTQQYRWQSRPHTGRSGRNVIWESRWLRPRGMAVGMHGIYSAGVMSVWLIGTTIGAHVLRVVYSTHQAAGTPGLEVPWVSTQRLILNSMNKRLKLFSLEHSRRRKDWSVFMFVPAGMLPWMKLIQLPVSPAKHPPTHEANVSVCCFMHPRACRI